MDYSTDHVRREALASQREHDAAMPALRRLLLDGSGRGNGNGTLVVALSRRRFLRVGGATVAAAAVLAACGNDDDAAQSPEDAADDAAAAQGAGSGQDVAILRTASSLELVAVDVYQRLIDSGVLSTTAVADAAKLFQGQHKAHGDLFGGATKELGGEPFEEANPVLRQQFDAALAAVRDEAAAVRLALQIGNAAAATYFANAGTFDDDNLNRLAASVAGVEARHVAVLAGIVGQPQVPHAFQLTDGAVAVGTGIG